MQASFRQYNHATDYQKVGEFLTRTYRTEGGHINWLQPRWEYMHYHPLIRGVDLTLISVVVSPDRFQHALVCLVMSVTISIV